MIELQHLTKRFATQGGTVVALNDNRHEWEWN